MSMIEQYTYAAALIESSYNIKWTILSNVKYIVTSRQELNRMFTGEGMELQDESFIDFLPENRGAYPVFAVDYLGERLNPSGSTGAYVISYRGNDNNFQLNHSYGIMGVKRHIQHLHDSMIATFKALSHDAGTKLYDFTNPDNAPVDTCKLFTMKLEESSFEQNPMTGRPMGGFDLIYSVELR